MTQITSYNVIADRSLAGLVKKINGAISEGWQPYGQMVFTEFVSGNGQKEWVFAQSVVTYQMQKSKKSDMVDDEEIIEG